MEKKEWEDFSPQIDFIDKSLVPPIVMEHFLLLAKRYMLPNEFNEDSLHSFAKIERTNPSYTTYIVRERKKYEDINNEEEQIYLYEVTKDEEKIGNGEIRYCDVFDERAKTYFENKPFV